MQVQPFYREKAMVCERERKRYLVATFATRNDETQKSTELCLMYLNRFTHELGIVGRATGNERQTLVGGGWQIRQAREKLHPVRRFRGCFIGGEFWSARSRGSCRVEACVRDSKSLMTSAIPKPTTLTTYQHRETRVRQCSKAWPKDTCP
jgi:hypothetical protein